MARVMIGRFLYEPELSLSKPLAKSLVLDSNFCSSGNDPVLYGRSMVQKKSFKIIKEQSDIMPGKNIFVTHGGPLWWHLLSEQEVTGITVNTGSE